MTPTWCEEPAALSDREYSLLLETIASVLAESAPDSEEAEEIAEYPRNVLTGELRQALSDSGVEVDVEATRRMVEDAATERALGVALIREICDLPELRQEVDEAFQARSRMLIVDPATIAAASLLLLVLKVRRVKVSRRGVDVQLDPVRGGALEFVTRLLNLGPPA